MVRQIFGPFGAIDACLLINDPITQKFTGAGFVTFNEGECGKSAMRFGILELSSKKMRSNNRCGMECMGGVAGGGGAFFHFSLVFMFFLFFFFFFLLL